MSAPAESSSVTSIFFVLLLSLTTLYIAKKNGFFRLSPDIRSSWPTFLQTLGGFLVYIVVSILALPFVYLVSRFGGMDEPIKHIDQLSNEIRGWLQWGTIIAIFVALLLYCLLIRKEVRQIIFWREKKPNFATAVKDFAMGALTWLISYPIIMGVSLIAGMISKHLWGKSGVEQVAVQQLLEIKGHSLLFAAMVLVVIVIVPFIEELLFRGFLQSWLRRKIGRSAALILTAFIFACVHFSKAQGIGNFELIVALFALSCFLGFIYERQRTLWASFGLHCTFNAISVFVLSVTK